MFDAEQFAQLAGMSEDVLEAWERRYGFPPSTTDGASGVKLYDECWIETVKLVRHQSQNGFTISQAILLLGAAGRLPGRLRFPDNENGDQ